jgi:hypothetical protein
MQLPTRHRPDIAPISPDGTAGRHSDTDPDTDPDGTAGVTGDIGSTAPLCHATQYSFPIAIGLPLCPPPVTTRE